MINTVFACTVWSSNPKIPLGLEIWADQQQQLNVEHVDSVIKFQHQFSDLPSGHEIKLVLKNKEPKHTVLDSNGIIISDALLHFDNFEFDGLDCTYLVHKYSSYQQSSFFGAAGCNGDIVFTFSTPFHLWLLEYM